MKKPMTRLLRSACLIALAIGVGCSSAPPQVQPPEPPTVTVSKPFEKELQPFEESIGRIVAIDEVTITPEVSGMLMKVNFKEGNLVKKGEVLYEIDPIPYQAALDKSVAEVSNSEAQYNLADKEVKRLEQGGNAVTKADFDKAVAQKVAMQASISVAKAEVTRARFNLEKTKIVAPVDGRIGRYMKTVGNVVTPTTQLAKIGSIDPIYAVWDVDEQTSLYYRKLIYIDKVIPDPRIKPLKCWIRLKSDTDYSREGYVNFIDPEVSRDSATRPIRGLFVNPDGFITPGDSVRVRVEAGPTRKAIVIPEGAVGSQQSRKFVYVVDADDNIVQRDLVLGEVRDGLQVVEKGVTTADRIVVNGLLRVRPGMKVKPVVEESASPKTK
jgi:RND family efflux transporter MFP subunit